MRDYCQKSRNFKIIVIIDQVRRAGIRIVIPLSRYNVIPTARIDKNDNTDNNGTPKPVTNCQIVELTFFVILQLIDITCEFFWHLSCLNNRFLFFARCALKSRTVLNIALFIAIAAAVLSFVGFVLAFVVKGEQVYVPVGKNYYKTMEDTGSEEKKESFYFGKNPNNMSAANIFDSNSRFIALTEQQTTDTVEEGQVVPEMSKEDIFFYLENPDKCALLPGYELTGTIVAKDNDFSFAILKGSKGSAGGAVTRSGAEVQEGVILAFVWRNIAIFRTTSGVKCIGEGVGETKSSPVPEAPKTAGETQPKGGDDEFDIRNVGPNQYVVKRADLNKATGNLGALASQARIVPSAKDNGFKIFSIAKDSLYSKIGIQNGDVLKSINGIELSSPDKALEAYSRLQSASKLSLDIVRKGQNETLEYTIE